MLPIETLASLIVTGLLLTTPTTARPLYPNTTDDAPRCATPQPSPPPASAPPCSTLYPSEYRVMNSRYPAHDQSPLHGERDFFMLLRQRDDTFQVSSQIQFYSPSASNETYRAFPQNSTCRLQFQLPTKEMQTTFGAEPIFNVYQVDREAGAPASWATYEAGYNASTPVFGRVNGTVAAQAQTRNETGGLVDIGTTACNETLTWQMGMAFNGGAEVNYWDFINVAPPFNPVQGFRVLAGC